MKRYVIDVDQPGIWRICDIRLGRRPGVEVAKVFDGELAQRIVDLLNGSGK